MQPTAQMPPANTATTGNGNKYLVPFILVAFLFFLWGMVHNLDGILIPHLKKAFQLSNTESMLIDSAIFTAYFLMAIPAGMILKRWGYKKGIITGLIIAGIGAFLFVPAANTTTYFIFLIALFIVGCGITILETAANPYAAILGKPESASTRLNLGAAVNGLAVFIAPLLGSRFIFSGIQHSDAQIAAMTEVEKAAYLSMEVSRVNTTYICIALGFIAVAVMFFLFRLPEAKDASTNVKLSQFAQVLKHKHLKWAVVAQFFYVGAQVCVTSVFVRMAMKYGGVNEVEAGNKLGYLYGSLFLIGRFLGTILTRYFSSSRLLMLFSIGAALFSVIAITGHGQIVIYAMSIVGFFMSIMFPTIFALGLVDLKEETKAGSSLLVMAIVGGAILPPVMGQIVDWQNDNIKLGFAVPLICFLVILFFSIRGYKPVVSGLKNVENNA
jgi:MFS transporter, FHS family, L-fucose permease